MNHRTEQESFLAGEFGEVCAWRNRGAGWGASIAALFSRILVRTSGVRSVIELVANIGLNVLALWQLFPDAAPAAVEINAHSVAELRHVSSVQVHHQSLLDLTAAVPADLAFAEGVLIHIAPERLPDAYDLLHRSSRRYGCVIGYYNPTPVVIPYRGHADRLFKRDFAGELRARFPDLRLLDYGFVYHGDPNFPQDDLTWFLLENTANPTHA